MTERTRWRRPDGAGEGHRTPAAKETLILRRDTHLDSLIDRLGLDRGTLIVFDSRKGMEPMPGRGGVEEVETKGRKVTVLRL
jgi:hypothetical protein